MNQSKPVRYVIQKKVMASSVQEALSKEPDLPVDGVFPDGIQPENPKADAIGFRTVDLPPAHCLYSKGK